MLKREGFDGISESFFFSNKEDYEKYYYVLTKLGGGIT